MVPEADFDLVAVAMRFPRALAARVSLAPKERLGICEVGWRARPIPIVVPGQVEPHLRNAFWGLFSLDAAHFRHGLQHYHFQGAPVRTHLTELYRIYKKEVETMAYTVEDFLREPRGDVIDLFPPDVRPIIIDAIPVEERLRGLPPEERGRAADTRRRLLLSGTRLRWFRRLGYAHPRVRYLRVTRH